MQIDKNNYFKIKRSNVSRLIVDPYSELNKKNFKIAMINIFQKTE